MSDKNRERKCNKENYKKKQNKKGNLFCGIYEVMATDEDKIQQRFKRERQEDNELEGR